MRALVSVVAAMLMVSCQPMPSNEPAAASQPVSPAVTDAASLAWLPAVDAVVDAFGGHQVVAVGEIHGSRAIHAFLQELVEEPRLVGVVNDVAVEFGSARHQVTIDRYVAGEVVPAAELELVWTDTTQRSGVWDSPVYRAFFELIRALNADRQPDDQIRVLLGDPPIDWDAITETTECAEDDPHCLDHWLFQRDEHFAEVIRTQSLDRGRRVLVIAGAGHVRRQSNDEAPRSLIDELDASHPGATWTMLPIEASALRAIEATVGALEPPSFAVAIPLTDRRLADLPVDIFFDRGSVTCDHPPCEEPDAATERLGQTADALLVP